MKSNKKYNYLLASLLLIAALTAIVFMLFYKDTTGLGAGFNVAVIYMLVFSVSLISGIFALFLRITGVFKSRVNFIYTLTGTLNFCVGALAIVLYFLGEAEMWWLNRCLISLLIGFLILADIYLINTKAT